MFPFQNNNPFFPLNVDLSSSQYLPKQEIPSRMPQMYTPESHPAYNNLPSLLNKRPSPVDLNSAPVKMIHQDPFSFAGDIYSARELPKSLGNTAKPETIDPQKLLYRSQQELYGLPKGLALNGQQFPGLANGLGFPAIDISPIEAQAYLGDNSSQAFLRQYLDSKGMNGREYGAQIQQTNDGMQRYLASLYGLQGGGVSANIGLQNLAGLGDLGNLGGLAGLGGLGNLGNINQLNQLNQPGVVDLLSQLRNQQMLQQLNQSLSLQLIPGLQESLKNDPNAFRNPNWADLMLLNSAAAQPNNLFNSLQSFNLGPSPIQQSHSPNSHNKSLSQSLGLQKPEPIRQHEPIAQRKETVNGASKTAPTFQSLSQEANEVKAIPFGNSENKTRKENIPEKMGRPNRAEQEARELKTARLEKEAERLLAKQQQEAERLLAKQQQEARNRRQEMQQQQHQFSNPSVPQQQQQQQMQMQKTVDKKPSKPYMTNERPEQIMSTEKLSKKAIAPGYERAQKPVNFEETRQQLYSQSQQQQALRNRKSEVLESELNKFGQRQERMMGDFDERRLNALTDPHSELLKKVRGYTEVETDHHHIQDHERIDPIPEITGENKDHTLTGEINTHQHIVSGENFYKTPERVEEQHVPQKIVETRVGERFQTDLPELILNDDDDDDHERRRRVCRLCWDPEYANSKEVMGYLKGLHRVLGTKVINQEKALQLLAKKNFNIEEVLNVIRKNERYYANLFGISNCTRELRSRRSVE